MTSGAQPTRDRRPAQRGPTDRAARPRGASRRGARPRFPGGYGGATSVAVGPLARGRARRGPGADRLGRGRLDRGPRTAAGSLSSHSRCSCPPIIRWPAPRPSRCPPGGARDRCQPGAPGCRRVDRLRPDSSSIWLRHARRRRTCPRSASTISRTTSSAKACRSSPSIDHIEVPGGVVRPIVDPVPIYPWSIAWRRGLRREVVARDRGRDEGCHGTDWLELPAGAWLPEPEASRVTAGRRACPDR